MSRNSQFAERIFRLIELNHVSKSFGSIKVLEDISFAVPSGSTFALLGLSGSGKTTALKLICGLHCSDVGNIRVQDLVVNADNISKIRSQIGYVMQDGGLFPHLTAEENLSLVGREAQWSNSKIRSRIEELCEMTKLSFKVLKQYPAYLSGGQRQRVGFMRSLLLDPPVLLLDEPLGALDPITRSELQIETNELCQKLKKCVLLVTHDLFEAGFLADHILLLHEGRIAQQGKMADLVRNPANEFVKRFVDSQKYHLDLQ